MLRLFLDQNLRVEIARALRDDGHDVVHAGEVGLERRDDARIFRRAQQHQHAIITFDADFAERALWASEAHRGVIRLRVEAQTPTRVIPVLCSFLAAYPAERLRNTLAIITENKVRLRTK